VPTGSALGLLQPWWGLGEEALRSSRFREFESLLVQEFCENSRVWCSAIAARGLPVNQLLHGEKNCIVYSLFCILITAIIIIIVISITFIVLLNCLYLSPRVSPFVHVFSPPRWQGRGGLSERLSGPGCQLQG